MNASPSSGDRYVVLGLAHVRAAWFREVARWSTGSAIPVAFVMCLSPEELRVRLASGRVHSAILIDGGLPEADRSLMTLAETHECPVVVVNPASHHTDWLAIGAAAVLTPDFDREALLSALHQHARVIGPVDVRQADSPAAAEPDQPVGQLVVVTGSGGTGASVCAMALAAALAAPGARRVVLADLSLNADLAMLHDVGDVVPGLPELVEAHRRQTVPSDVVRSLTYDIEAHGYHLLLGLRRHHDWTALAPVALRRGLGGLRSAYDVLVCDVDADFEGERESGSIDVEERNGAARAATADADAVFVVGGPGPKGLHSIARVLGELAAHGIDSGRVVPVINRASRRKAIRRELARTLVALASGEVAGCARPVFLPERRSLDEELRHAAAAPIGLGAPLADALTAMMAPLGSREAQPVQPALVRPGTIGALASPGLS